MITDIIRMLKVYIHRCWSVIAVKGGIVPFKTNTNNLPGSIRSLNEKFDFWVFCGYFAVTYIHWFDINSCTSHWIKKANPIDILDTIRVEMPLLSGDIYKITNISSSPVSVYCSDPYFIARILPNQTYEFRRDYYIDVVFMVRKE